jgi:hypothetical protein
LRCKGALRASQSFVIENHAALRPVLVTLSP